MQDGQPPLGWPETAAYLVLPVLLVASQYISMQLMQPPQVVPSFLKVNLSFALTYMPRNLFDAHSVSDLRVLDRPIQARKTRS